MNPADDYLKKCEGLLEKVRNQKKEIQRAADWFAETILAGRMVHVFGSGHSRILVEEMWPRYGSFPGFNPIVELSLTFHNPVVGANGQRQAMFLENTSGLAERILRNFDKHIWQVRNHIDLHAGQVSDCVQVGITRSAVIALMLRQVRLHCICSDADGALIIRVPRREMAEQDLVAVLTT